MMLDANDSDQDEEAATIAYRTDRNAETTVFKTQKAQSDALVAKMNRRRKKPGAPKTCRRCS